MSRASRSLNGCSVSSSMPAASNGDASPIAKPDHHHERIGAEAAGDEGERVGGRAVEPLDVVGDHQDRRAGGGIREQRERREGDEERVLCRSFD